MSDTGENGVAVKWPLVVKLTCPIEAFGETIAELKFREPNVADAIKFGVLDGSIDGDADKDVDLLAHLSSQTPQTIRSFPAAEYLKIRRQFWNSFRQAMQ